MRPGSATAVGFVVVLLSAPPAARASDHERIALRCGRLIDGRGGVREGLTVLVEGERIQAVGPAVDVPAGARVIDLSRATCLPGLIDNHTHVLLQGDITAEEYDRQLLRESIAYRTIRATLAARRALELLGRQEDLGTLEPGRLADVVAVAGDPLRDVAELEKVGFVMKAGVVVKALANGPG